MLLLALSCTTAAEDSAQPVQPTQEHPAEGRITWHTSFSEASGHADCSYTRRYAGAAEPDLPWLCPDCDQQYGMDVELVEGADCYAVVSDGGTPAPREWIGVGNGQWYRNGAGRGSATVDEGGFTVQQSVSFEESGSFYAFEIEGEFSVREGDPLEALEPPQQYACGWPKADPPAYDGDWSMAIGQTLPDGVFVDQCGEPVRLHDFAGRIVLLVVSAMNCPPCRDAAAEEPAFVAQMEAEGFDVEVVTLQAPSLSDIYGTPTPEDLAAWVDYYGLHSPVLADRMYGPVVVRGAIPDDYAYPSFVLVKPDLDVVAIETGFGGYEEFAELIRAL